jgi:flagellar FliL protein
MSDAPKGEAAAAPEGAAPAKSGSKFKLVLIAGVVVLLAGAGGGGYWWWSHRAPADPKAEAKAKEEEKHDPADSGVVSFEPFVANLADEGGSRFLRASLKLVVAGAEAAKEVEESPVEVAQLQSAILETLTVQTAEHLVTPEGKAALKKQVIAKANHILHGTKVTDVLFTEFVVQF